MKLEIQLLEKNHHKKSFECGQSLLDDYIRKQAKQDVSRELSACFVLADESAGVKGYYTLSSNAVRRDDFPEELIKKLPPSYSDLPTILLGRLAIDQSLQGQGYGEILLINALNRCVEISRSIGTLAVVVDPIDESAERFYSNYGFILLPGTGKMMLPIKTIRESIQ